jgi:hypothetical protein
MPPHMIATNGNAHGARSGTAKSREASMITFSEQGAECVRLADRRGPRPPSPYFINGAPRACARCAAPFRQRDEHIACWHGADQHYYCSEACAQPAGLAKTAA